MPPTSRWPDLALALTALAVAPLPGRAQDPAPEPLHVLHHQPERDARPGDVITITFDRPVAGTLEHTFDPARFVHLAPRVPARVEWRDPSTIRIIPDEPLTPGNTYRVRVDTGFSAIDGSHLAEPFTLALPVRGPVLVRSAPYVGSYESRLGLDGTVRLLYSAPVGDSAFRSVRFTPTGPSAECASARPIAFRVSAERPVRDADPWEIRSAGHQAGRDSLADRFRRVVELTMAGRPEWWNVRSCTGALSLPSLDSLDAPMIQYPMATPRPFAIESVVCDFVNDCAASQGVYITFTGVVARDALVAAVRLDPPDVFTLPARGDPSNRWHVSGRIAPRSTYRVTIDSSLRDTYGRVITNPGTTVVEVGDRSGDFGYQPALVTIARGARPSLRIRHVNVDSVELLIMPVPDSMRARALLASQPFRGRPAAWIPSDTIRAVVALHTPLNVEATAEIPIPGLMVAGRPQLVAVQARVRARSRHNSGDSVLSGTRQLLPDGRMIVNRPPILIVGSLVPDTATTSRAFVQSTSLAAHVKVGAGGGAVWVTSVATGRPVAGAAVHVVDSTETIVATATTDEQGLASFTLPPPRFRADYGRWYPGSAYLAPDVPALVVEVTSGADRSVTIAGAGHADLGGARDLGAEFLDRYSPRRPGPVGVVFADRGIYRPGESVHVSAIVRDGDLGALAVPAGDSVRLRLERTSRQDDIPPLIDSVLALSDYGTATCTIALPAGADLDTYSATVAAWRGGGWHRIASTDVRVAEYRAPTFAVKASGDAGAALHRGDTLRARVNARYLFDAPMVRAPVQWSATFAPLRPGDIHVPGLAPGFEIGEGPQWWDLDSEGEDPAYLNGADTLDATGRAIIALPTDSARFAGGTRVTMQLAVTDLDRQAVTTRLTQLVHAGDFYVALRDAGPRATWWWTTDRARPIGLVVVRPDGRRVRGVHVRLTTIRFRWRAADQLTGRSGRWRADTVATGSAISADSVVTAFVTPNDAGPVAVLATATDAAGRDVRTALVRYAWDGAAVAGPGGAVPNRLPVTVDHDSVRAGDTVTVRFTSPFARADAWITTEREGVRSQHVLRDVAGKVVWRLPVAERDAPTLFIGVTLVATHRMTAGDSLPTLIRAGYAALHVDYAPKRLAVDVSPGRPAYQPGDSAAVRVRVLDDHGRPQRAELTVWAVDQAVVALTDFAPPDPVRTLYADAGDGLILSTTLRSLQGRLPPWLWRAMVAEFAMSSRRLSFSVASAAGNGAISVASKVRTDFRTLAFFRAHVITNANGEANVRVRLPENVTTFRLYAIAAGAGDRYGRGESSFVTTQPLVVRAAMPRFVRNADSVYAGATIVARDGAPHAVTASATGTGLDLFGPASVSLSTGTTGAIARFAWRRPPDANGDTARVRLEAAGDSLADGVEIPLPVRPDQRPRARAVSGIVRDSTVVPLNLAPGVDPARTHITLRAGSDPLPLLRAARDFVIAYPYDCTEQLASTARVLLAMLRLERRGVRVLDDTIGTRATIQGVVDEMARRQMVDGGISYWRGALAFTWTALSAEAGGVLLDANAAGFDVDTARIQRLAAYFSQVNGKPGLDADTAWGTRADRARAVAATLHDRLRTAEMLRRLGRPNADVERWLVEQAPRMAWDDRARLTLLLGRSGQAVRAAGLVDELWNTVGTVGARVDFPDSTLWSPGFPSHIRPVADLLLATLALRPEHPRLGMLVQRLVTRTEAERDWWWWNTQDYAAAAEAIAAYVAVVPPGPTSVRFAFGSSSSRAPGVTSRPVPVGLGLLTASHVALEQTVLLADVMSPGTDAPAMSLRLIADGRPAYYSVTIDEVMQARPVAPEVRGLTVERWFERFDDGRTVTEVAEGDLVRVRLRVTAPSDREFVALEDPLPAGLEAVDLSLHTSGTLGPFSTRESDAAARAREGEAGAAGTTPWGSWWGGWWSPWDHREIHDDRVTFFARILWRGSWTVSYVARATSAGKFVLPQAQAEEMYNPAATGRSDGGWFTVRAP